LKELEFNLKVIYNLVDLLLKEKEEIKKDILYWLLLLLRVKILMISKEKC
jgi:hypothetical protein